MGAAVIWLLSNYLFYRALWGGHHDLALTVPAQMVWEKILSAPANSTLDIYNNDHKIGFCRWGVGAANSPLTGSKVLSPEKQAGHSQEKPNEYGLSFAGSAMIGESNHLRFQTSLALDTNQNWKDLHLHASVPPGSWTLLAVAAKQSVVLDGDDDNGVWNKTWSFSDLENPQTWLGDFIDPTTLSLLGLNHSFSDPKSPGMQWEAHEDHKKFGKSDFPVYRLDSSVLGQHIEVVASRIGEILWVDLPFRLSLRNQALPASGKK